MVTVLRTWTGRVIWRQTDDAARMLVEKDDAGVGEGFMSVAQLFREVRYGINRVAPHWEGRALSHNPPRKDGWRFVVPLAR